MGSQLESLRGGGEAEEEDNNKANNLLDKIAAAKPSKKIASQTPKYENLGQKIAYDVASAACAALLVAPLITMIDRGIIENASGRADIATSLRTSLKTLLTRPHSFLLSRPFGLISFLYTSTYFTANSIDTQHSIQQSLPASSVSPTTTKFLATSATNMSLSLVKDAQFTRLFGVALSSPRPVPTPSFALFALRDSLTIFASFNLPSILAPTLPVGEAWEKTVMSRMSTAQFLAPAAMQIVSTPLHLLGLDLYNRPSSSQNKVAWRSRAGKVWTDWAKSTGMRMARIVPAFGVGGVVNANVRGRLMKRLES